MKGFEASPCNQDSESAVRISLGGSNDSEDFDPPALGRHGPDANRSERPRSARTHSARWIGGAEPVLLSLMGERVEVEDLFVDRGAL